MFVVATGNWGIIRIPAEEYEPMGIFNIRGLVSTNGILEVPDGARIAARLFKPCGKAGAIGINPEYGFQTAA